MQQDHRQTYSGSAGTKEMFRERNCYREQLGRKLLNKLLRRFDSRKEIHILCCKDSIVTTKCSVVLSNDKIHKQGEGGHAFLQETAS